MIFRRARFADVIARQLDLFERDNPDVIEEARERLEAYNARRSRRGRGALRRLRRRGRDRAPRSSPTSATPSRGRSRRGSTSSTRRSSTAPSRSACRRSRSRSRTADARPAARRPRPEPPGGGSPSGASGSFVLLRMRYASRTIIQTNAIGKRITGQRSPLSDARNGARREARSDLGLPGGLAGERAEGLDLVDEDVLVAADALEAAAGEQERLAADDRAVGLVDGRRDDQVHLAVLVLEQHEDDALGGRGALAGDGEAGDGDPRAVRDAGELVACNTSAGRGAGAGAPAGGGRPRSRCGGSRRASAPSRSAGGARGSRRSGSSGSASWRVPPPALSPRGVTPRRQSSSRLGPHSSQAPEATSASSASLPAERAAGEVADVGVRLLGDERLGLAPRRPSGCSRGRSGRRPSSTVQLRAAAVHVRRVHLDPAPLRVADERGGRVEAHRLRVQERAEELGRVVAPQPRRLVGEQRRTRRRATSGSRSRRSRRACRRSRAPSARRSRCRGSPRRTAAGTPRSPPRCACGSSRGAALRPPPR